MPQFYQTFFTHLLSPKQYILLCLIIRTLQTHKHLCAGKLSQALPLPITADSRKRALQRFLTLDILNVFEAWFPVVLYLLNTYFPPRCTLKLALDRTTWWHYNVLSVVLVWDRHALPLNWTLLDHTGNSDFEDQQLLLSPVLCLLSEYRIVLLGDREFCSVKLADWLRSREVGFCLRLKVSEHIQPDGHTFQSLKSLDLKPGMSLFFQGVRVTKHRDNRGFAPFNVACYWAEKVRDVQPGEGWYLLTDQKSLKATIRLYGERWGIEVWHKDLKSGGYHLEEVRVSWERMMRVLLLAAVGWSIGMIQGSQQSRSRVSRYAGRTQEKQRQLGRHSTFRMGQYGLSWSEGVAYFSEWMEKLIGVCPNRAKDYRRGLRAARLMLSVT
ncbi:MAG: IS4 family transposase [Gemmatimonadaceae bacterium]|nr:IS4 family transposase [Gloeobacterales cyanobacterium ES-bin-141]